MSEHKDDTQIERYTADDRSFHWATAISFILLAISGSVMCWVVGNGRAFCIHLSAY